MSRRIVWLLLALLVVLGAAVFSDLTWRKRKQERELRDFVQDTSRYVDIGVELVVVVEDPNGEELIPGKPRLRVLRRTRHGYIIDTRARGARCIWGPTRKPRVWYCSEEQEAIILHPDSEPLGQLIYGSEGGGKTETLPMWHYFRWLEHIGQRREGGQLAPTQARLEVFLEKFGERFSSKWYRYRSSKRLITLCDGTRIRLVSTHRQSEAQGSPVQGYGWSWAAIDEAQDTTKRWDDVEARGRAARIVVQSGENIVWFKQARTATAKDTYEWRGARDKLLNAGTRPDGMKLWCKRTLLGVRSPFIARSFWEDKKRTMDPREYRRRVLAEDLPPELAVFYGWQRERNLVALPRIAADVTPHLLADYPSFVRPGARFTLVCCHDPGNIFNTTVVLRLLMFGDVPTWVAVGELQTKQTTARQHARALRTYLQRTFGVDRGRMDGERFVPDPDSSKALIFCDPHGKGEGETDYQTVYMAFQREGLDVLSASSKRIKRSARVEMTNRLLCDANEVARLVVACDELGQPLAPVLVHALESLQKRPGEDDPEGQRRKDETDQTHAPAALGYGLWPFEQEALSPDTIRRARDAARRLRI